MSARQQHDCAAVVSQHIVFWQRPLGKSCRPALPARSSATSICRYHVTCQDMSWEIYIVVAERSGQ